MVNFYSKPGCGGCMATKRALDKYDIDYNYIDVSKSPEAFDYIINTLGYQGVPVVETETEHWIGYKEDKIKGLV